MRPVVLMLLGVCFAAAATPFTKYLAQEEHVFTLVWLRFSFAVILLAPFVSWHQIRVEKAQAVPHILRALIAVGTMLAFFSALSQSSIPTVVAVFYFYPVLTLFVAIFMFGQQFSMVTWGAAFCSILGVSMVIQPDIASGGFGVIYAFIAAVFMAVRKALDRLLILKETTPFIVHYVGICIAAVLLSIPGALNFDGLSWTQLGALLCLTCLGTGNQLLIIQAIKSPKWATVSLLAYWEIILSVPLSVVFFADIPDALTLTGIAVLIASGVIVMGRMNKG